MKSPVTIGPIELRPVDQLVAYANNARTHSEAQIDQIVSSIKEFGFTNPILIDPDNVIIAGHARLRAVRKLGCQQVEVRVLAHLSKTQRRALAIADNQLALNAGWDEELLRAELAALKEEGYDLDVLGFDNGELARLIADEQDSHGLQDADMVPATDVEAVTIMGDLWRLGDHSLLCADATSREALDTVLGGKGADMVFCDPPFNCAYVGRTAQQASHRQ